MVEFKMNFRFIVTASDNISQWWMSELLIHSYKRVKQQDPLTFLWATDSLSKPQFIPSYGDVFLTPLYEKIIPNEKYVMYNRIYGLENYLKNNYIPEDYLVIIDPDMIFTKNFTFNYGFTPSKCKPIVGLDLNRRFNSMETIKMYTRYCDTGILEKCVFNVCPYLIHKDDLLCIIDEWKELTIRIRRENKPNNVPWYLEWTSDIIALDIVSYKNQMDFTVDNNLWNYIRDTHHPSLKSFTHYFDGFTNDTKTWKFYKHFFQNSIPCNIISPINLTPICYHLMVNIIERFGGHFSDNPNLDLDYSSTNVFSTHFL